MDMSHLDGGDSTVAVPSDDASTTMRPEDARPSSSANGAGRSTATTRSLFLDVLTHAMQTAADQERTRIVQVVADDAALNVEHARVRGAAESSELCRLADEDIDGIQRWLATSIAELQLEATRRTDERRALLDDYLRQHDVIIQAEIASVDVAVNDYEETLAAFFSDLHQAEKPSEIASKADLLPTPPDLDAARAAARASAVQAYADRPAEPPDEIEVSPEVVAAPAPASAFDADSVAATEATADVEPTVEPPVEPETLVEPEAPGANVAAPAIAALVGVMDPSLPVASAGPPDILHSVEPDPTDAAEAPDDEEAAEPSAALRLVRSIFSRPDDL